MKKINYKEIAEIIKKRIEFIKISITKKYQEPLLAIMKLLAEDLADYFQKENRHSNGCIEHNIDRELVDCICEYSNFNRQQFLKDCSLNTLGGLSPS